MFGSKGPGVTARRGGKLGALASMGSPDIHGKVSGVAFDPAAPEVRS
jgi:hypothetical protein